MTYWYRVQYVTEAGHYSGDSNVVSIKIPGERLLPQNQQLDPNPELKNTHRIIRVLKFELNQYGKVNIRSKFKKCDII